MTDDEPTQRIINGDCLDVMADMDENSVHAVVCDPPYGLSFLDRDWDNFRRRRNEDDVSRDNAFGRASAKAPASGAETESLEYQKACREWATEALQVLKPGGHLIAFSGNRTHHRLMAGVEDAGFEIRDTITYHYGTGFPKGSDIGKYIDRYYDAEDEREAVGENPNARVGHTTGEYSLSEDADNFTGNGYNPITEPATSEAEKWDGWRTQLKPAVEFAVLARAPMSESAVYRNVLEHGTGALNIDRTRIPTEDSLERKPAEVSGTWSDRFPNKMGGDGHEDGRYPANLLLDGVAARMLDEQSGVMQGGKAGGSVSDGGKTMTPVDPGTASYDDRGGASRFFYTSKASKTERTIDGQVENEHPTVKPVDLMEYLVTLVTAPGQTVLDPFAGSGTTIMACRRLNREGIGIEQDPDHADLARQRVDLAHEIETDQVDADESDTESADSDGPTTLESFGDD